MIDVKTILMIGGLIIIALFITGSLPQASLVSPENLLIGKQIDYQPVIDASTLGNCPRSTNPSEQIDSSINIIGVPSDASLSERAVIVTRLDTMESQGGSILLEEYNFYPQLITQLQVDDRYKKTIYMQSSSSSVLGVGVSIVPCKFDWHVEFNDPNAIAQQPVMQQTVYTPPVVPEPISAVQQPMGIFESIGSFFNGIINSIRQLLHI